MIDNEKTCETSHRKRHPKRHCVAKRFVESVHRRERVKWGGRFPRYCLISLPCTPLSNEPPVQFTVPNASDCALYYHGYSQSPEESEASSSRAIRDLRISHSSKKGLASRNAKVSPKRSRTRCRRYILALITPTQVTMARS